jgi:hypothetical protein
MGEMLRILALFAGLLAFALPVAAFDGPPQSNAGKKQPAAKQAPPGEEGGEDGTKSAALVQQIFEGGIKAYGVGKYDEAQRAFEAAIRAGMPSSQMPRVLYYRGLTFRKMGKPGFAVSDLTSALWLKGGLSEAERADAIKNRALAYHESGVSEVPPVPQSAYAEAPALPGREKQTAMAAGSSAAAPSNAPAAPTPTSSSSGGIGGFFSSLFGGGSSSESSESAPAATASIATDPAPASDSAGWGASTEVVPHAAAASPPEAARAPEIGSPFVTQVAAVAEPGRAPAASAGGSGGIKLQVASVRSRSEAEALAGLLVGRHGDELGGRRPAVDQTVIGSMGTFYRVRIGPFANDREPQQLCNVLKPDGFDCLVVAE